MIARSFLFAVFTLVLSCYSHANTESNDSSFTQRLVHDVYRPLHRNFADAAERFNTEANGLCERRSSSSAYRLQSDFTTMLEAYSAIEFFRLGPLLQDNRKNRLFYWPDKRRVGKRQLKSLLGSSDVLMMDVDLISNKSVAVQGFTALEQLLFSEHLHPLENESQCHVIQVVAQNIANIAAELDAEWQSDSDFVNSILLPNKDSPHFRTQNEVFRSVFTQATVGLDLVVNTKMQLLLNDDPKQLTQTPM